MTWHRQHRSGRGAFSRTLGSLAACLVLAACGSSSKNATIDITAPTKGQVLTSSDDVSSSKAGVQYTVTASSSGIATGTEVALRISDEDDVPVTKVGKDGLIEFESVTLPPGKHTLKVQTTGGVASADDYDYTLKAIVIDRPQNNASIGFGDDKDPNTEGIQINVSVSTYEIELSEDVSLQVDNMTYGSAQRPNANGKLVFSGVTLAEGRHSLKVTAGEAASEVVNVEVSTKCATAMFVTPEPPTNGNALKLAGGDQCPKNGEPYKTGFTISTDAGDGRDVDLVVNGTLFASTKVDGTLARFTDVVLDRYKTANKVSVVVQGAQGVTCNPIPYPVDIMVDCEGVDCSISAPQPVAGNDSSGKRVLYLNQSKKSKDGFEFEVHTIADAIGQPVKLIIDGNEGTALSADPSGSDPDVKAKFSAVTLDDREHTIQARCELKNGSFGLSRLATWIVDTKACEVNIRQPGEDSLLSSSLDADKNLSGVQIEVSSEISGSDCSASRAAVCDPTSGISDKVGYDALEGGSSLTSTVTLTNDAEQDLCVEVQDRAGNVGRDTVGVRFNVEAPKLVIETPANNDKFNSAGGGDYKADSDSGSADVCNANFDVACTQLGAAVRLHRDSATGPVFGMANCEAKGNNDPALPAGYAGRARIKNATFLANDSDTAKVIATQSLTSGGKELVGESPAITIKGDCSKPQLEFTQDPCNGGQLAVQTAQDTVSRNVVAEETTTDSQKATVVVTSGGSQFSTKEANVGSNGSYDFGSVSLGGPGSGKRSITIEVSAKDDYDNTGKVSCNADIVYDLPGLTVTTPADNLVLLVGQSSAPACTPAGGGTGVSIAATADQANNRTASYSVGMGSDSPLTLTGTAISGCAPIVEGPNDVKIKLTSSSTTATNTITRKVSLVGAAPTTGITIDAPQLPSDRNGKVTLSWTLPSQSVPGQLATYELRCDPTALNTNETTPNKEAWWMGARVVPLPTDFKPPTSTVQLDFRAGETNHCALRALDAGSQPTPVTGTTAVTVPFRQKRFAPTSTGQWAGWDLASVGDVNGDGRPDLLVGGGGEAHLVFGAADNAAWEAKGGAPDVTFVGRPDNYFAQDVAAIGDWNGDGRPDFAIGDPRDRDDPVNFPNLQGRVLIFFGRAAGDPFPSTVTIGDNCVADVCLIGGAGTAFGWSLAGDSDFDNDGRVDLAVGAPFYSVNSNPVGRLYVLRYNNYASGAAPGAGQFYNSSLTVDSDGAIQGFVFNGADTGAVVTRFLGNSVAALGTWDATAGADLVVAAPGTGASGVTGKAFFASGRSYAGPGLTQLALTQFGFIDNGAPSGTFIDQGTAGEFATSVFALGNVVNVAGQTAGRGDLGIFTAEDTGVYVYTGDTNFAPGQKVLVNGNLRFGSLVATGRTAGDLDGDGLAELCVSGESDPATNMGAGVPYLWYSNVFARKLGSGNLVNVSTGSRLDVNASTGVTRRSVEFAGDLNGDGKGDLVVGGAGANGNSGELTVLY